MTQTEAASHTEADMPPSPRELTVIVAATSKMGIGRAGTLPWTGLKREMAYFARVTKRASPGTENLVIMGRKTWDSIPPRFRPLKERVNVVVTRGTEPPESEQTMRVGSIEAALEAAARADPGSRAFVIGGAQIYGEALKRAETRRILLTRVLNEFECDTFFPVRLGADGKGEGWVRRSKEELNAWVGETVAEGEQEENGTRYVFEMWERA